MRVVSTNTTLIELVSNCISLEESEREGLSDSAPSVIPNRIILHSHMPIRGCDADISMPGCVADFGQRLMSGH